MTGDEHRWTEEGLAEFDRRTLELIARFGYTCIGVGGNPAFGYTVGHSTSIIVGLGDPLQAQSVLDIAVRVAGRPDGEIVTLPDTGGYQAVFAPVPEDLGRKMATVAFRHGAESVRQFVWQDQLFRWPWENGQVPPVFAGPDWRPNE